MDALRQKIFAAIDAASEDLKGLALDIHRNPELGFEEHKAVGFIAALLEKHGFSVTTGYGGLETSFRADRKGRGDGPTVAFLAEYDALKGIGHGCGHNLIAACSTGAFLGLAAVIGELDGSVALIGTPAEEGGAGKVRLLENCAFDGVDFALMMHPSSGPDGNLAGRGGRAASRAVVTFRGKAAHSSVPKNGINALSALIQTFVQIDSLRPTFDPQDNINGIITAGGTAANIIPDYAQGVFSLRAETMQRIEFLKAAVARCAESAAHLTGATLEFSTGLITAERYPNRPMNQAFMDAMRELGIELSWPDPKKQFGSSDIGNVSIKIPAIHDYLSITDDDSVKAHTTEFAQAACTPHALEVCLKGAKGLALTGCRVLADADFRRSVCEYHAQQIPPIYKQDTSR